jgi:hypothetical protein
MDQKTSMVAAVLLALTSSVWGQQKPENPRLPDDLLASRQLVAWSWMQKPRPAPQPLPPPDKGVPQPDQHTTQPADPQAPQQTAAQTFTGRIVKDGTKYVLKTGRNTAYSLDDQSKAMQYEDKAVRIVGTLDADRNTIRVSKIELLS